MNQCIKSGYKRKDDVSLLENGQIPVWWAQRCRPVGGLLRGGNSAIIIHNYFSKNIYILFWSTECVYMCHQGNIYKKINKKADVLKSLSSRDQDSSPSSLTLSLSLSVHWLFSFKLWNQSLNNGSQPCCSSAFHYRLLLLNQPQNGQSYVLLPETHTHSDVLLPETPPIQMYSSLKHTPPPPHSDVLLLETHTQSDVLLPETHTHSDVLLPETPPPHSDVLLPETPPHSDVLLPETHTPIQMYSSLKHTPSQTYSSLKHTPSQMYSSLKHTPM